MAAAYKPDSDAVHVLLDKPGVGSDAVGANDDASSLSLRMDKEEEGAGEKKEEEREKWASQKEYLLSTVGYCVGVGNVFRFPYVCNQNGGGAFLLPFIVCLFVIGAPMFFLETALGQFRGKSPLHVWGFCPILKGIGVTTFLLAAIVFWYFNIILAWSLYYLVSSFQATLPWTRCDQWWNTPNCRTFADFGSSSGNADGNLTSVNGNLTFGYGNVTSLNSSGVVEGHWEALSSLNETAGNQSSVSENGQPKIVMAAEEFWQHNVLQISGGLYETGEVVWYLAVAQTVVVLLIFLALFKGIKTSGKVVYVTATAPYVLLTVLLIRSATLPGALEGVLFYITPDFRKLVDYNIWIQASLQVFYSLAIAWGTCQTLSSFNKFNNNVLRDAVVVTLVGEGTSVYAGFAVFSVLGYLAHQSSVPVNEVVSSGPGLAFVVYPEALSLMPLSQLWAVFFFLMLLTVVFDTLLATGETLFTILSDQFPRTVHRHRVLVRASVSVLVLLFSLILATQGGMYVYQLVDWYIGSFTTTIIALLECVVVCWVYGMDRFAEDIQLMIGRKPPMIMKILWCFVLPVFFAVLLVFTLLMYQPPTYGEYQYDMLARVIGWMIAIVPFLPIPVGAVLQLAKAKGSLRQRLRKVCTPDGDWGPADPSIYDTYRAKMVAPFPRQNCFDVIRK
ncbi:sodium- and chloride-dependent glycine transporter 2-like [Babylonia areolata]|uniref:sodium- and chloride-dependent glycine transporter 2-like n=1 Tax=Babylonia areolata TaxID=304850 RepID=UPI003FD015E1